MHKTFEITSDSRKINIMHVLYSLDIGGLENGVVNLINRMDSDKFSHSICCIDQSGRYAEKLNRQDVKIFEMKKGDRREFLLPLKLARLFSKNRVDIIHTRNWGAVDGIAGARLVGIPVIIHGVHGRDATDPDGCNRKRLFIQKGLSYFVDRYITVSRDLRNWLITKAGVQEKKVQTIWNGVDTVKFNPEGKDLVRSKYGYKDEDIVIGIVGRLDPVKDQQLLIKSFSLLTKNYPHLILLIIGDGPCREGLEKMAKDLGLQNKVRFLGIRTDVPEVLKLLDIFVLPSIIEGISNTILESMATGVAVVATSVGGNPELVVDGETGYLVPKQDTIAMAKALEQYIENRKLIKSHGVSGRERIVREFSLDRMVAKYEETYIDLVMHKKHYR